MLYLDAYYEEGYNSEVNVFCTTEFFHSAIAFCFVKKNLTTVVLVWECQGLRLKLKILLTTASISEFKQKQVYN